MWWSHSQYISPLNKNLPMASQECLMLRVIMGLLYLYKLWLHAHWWWLNNVSILVGISVAILGDFWQILARKSLCKSSPNISILFGLFWKCFFLGKNCKNYFLGICWKFLDSFYSNIWSHWLAYYSGIWFVEQGFFDSVVDAIKRFWMKPKLRKLYEFVLMTQTG